MRKEERQCGALEPSECDMLVRVMQHDHKRAVRNYGMARTQLGSNGEGDLFKLSTKEKGKEKAEIRILI